MKLVGLSLSKCITDLVSDKASVNDVVVIYSGVDAESDNLDEIIERAKQSYWRKLNQGRLAETLWELSDKIRLLPRPLMPKTTGHWMIIVEHELAPTISNAELAAHANNFSPKAPMVQRLAELLLIERGLNPADVIYEVDDYLASGRTALVKANVFMQWKAGAEK